MSVSYGLGVVAGIAVVGACIFLFRKKMMNKGSRYDERQIAVRGQAYAAGFATFVFCELAVFMMELFTEKPLVLFAPGVLSILVILLSCLVFVEIAIFKDAYFTPERPFRKGWCALMLLLSGMYIVMFFLTGDRWNKVVNLAVAVCMLVVMASILLKRILSKGAEQAEDGE